MKTDVDYQFRFTDKVIVEKTRCILKLVQWNSTGVMANGCPMGTEFCLCQILKECAFAI